MRSKFPSAISLFSYQFYAGFLCIAILLYWGQMLLVPLAYGLFLSILLYPICRWFEKKGLSKSLSITISLLLVLVLFLLLIGMLIAQLNYFYQELPLLNSKALPAFELIQKWVTNNMNISMQVQNDFLKKLIYKFTDNSSSIILVSFNKTFSGLFMVFIIPVFASLFLYNRKDFVLFLGKLLGSFYKEQFNYVLHNTVITYFHFIRGMILVYLIVGTLNTIGLFALGIDNALLFGFMTAIMTIIPYVGIFVSSLLPITVAWITKDSMWYPIGVVGVFVFVQYLEANVIFPRVVATQLNLSTWSTLVAIISGGIIWGINGMILFIPFLGLFKIFIHNVPEFDAINILISRNVEKK